MTRESQSLYKHCKTSLEDKIKKLNYDETYATIAWAERIEGDMKSVEGRVAVTLEETRKMMVNDLLETEERVVNKTKDRLTNMREEIQGQVEKTMEGMISDLWQE